MRLTPTALPVAATCAALTLAGACSRPTQPADPFALAALPAEADYCRAAQRLVTRTDVAVTVEVQETFDGFVKSKALIDGPTIQQYAWRDTEGALLAISCKLKNADHLVAAFGAGRAGPDGACQDMNRAVYALLAPQVVAPAYPRVVFDPAETVVNEREPGMTGPDWLAPFTLTRVDPDGALRVLTKGFVVEFGDARFAKLPERFRGVHYCHFIAPAHLRALLTGTAQPGAVVGRRVEATRPPDVPR